MHEDVTVIALGKRLFAAEHGFVPADVDAVLADPRLSLPAAGIADALERWWVPFARAALVAIPVGGVAASLPRARSAAPAGSLEAGARDEGA